MKISKNRVAAIHLCISAVVALGAAWLVFVTWFPFPYSELAGGGALFLLIISVDVILGPLLTWIVFNPSKKSSEKFFDISVISIIQIAALAYGLQSAFWARPIYLVHEIDRLVVVTAADVDGELQKAPKNLQSPKAGIVKMIGIREPDNPSERMRSVELALAGRDVSLRPEYWQEISTENRAIIKKRAKPLLGLLHAHPAIERDIQELAEKAKKNPKDLVYLPMMGKGVVWSAVMAEGELGELDILGYLKIDGF